jgi:hypothetical protein
MAGTAVGNGLAARYGERIRRPVFFYAGLELTIVTAGLTLVLLLPYTSAFFGVVLSSFVLPGALLQVAPCRGRPLRCEFLHRADVATRAAQAG